MAHRSWDACGRNESPARKPRRVSLNTETPLGPNGAPTGSRRCGNTKAARVQLADAMHISQAAVRPSSAAT